MKKIVPFVVVALVGSMGCPKSSPLDSPDIGCELIWWCQDADRDGFLEARMGCTPPNTIETNWVVCTPPLEGERDCNDYNHAVHPGAEEICDGFDSDCDGDFDLETERRGEGCVRLDADGDGYTSWDGDCDDGTPEINPDAGENCRDGM
ncbi:hypothetical protein COY93_04910 [Candidatus Uhrbacteria bacterium CG_4_10_14_0_8_um_filter_58_22]|uniref:Lipoprotein n=1 Tax=Candidatus Uhrbacteria bacterium CG_4_10_14_0_8_um_filter_58_22 TaxID=1975029 RepID=A0A2M7Q8T3_9BACT|nr:MAG: hypothetical protein AUJ19_04495 [Parcubacteria group bacterium CG1_02_58_44]PIY61718.1 MAG: hypothetical protein COY93_04910 [Candidatus Uhrbacteria bacterium CG_4_10_14_0_8_um_filter_58_22]